ncbi:response regulator receiver [Oscillochloris trichoides DG-6]|uniref:Response regulator receiver n=1 Tax=Oscillochloris trichoides DG-6 TaxID=765420 RepID=E1IF32_9CHLR|nr:response regulator [Oscillochloris trichoides]EFO80199.1 response regulator receiver [Oscillochloris trichoides DG-6]
MTTTAYRILIVDDTPLNLKMVSAALASGGYQIETATTGHMALDRAVTFRPDLFILDVMMPDIDGYEVCRRLRRMTTFAQHPILMLTANDTLEERVRGLEAGADDYMSKPFQPIELQARVKALLRRVPLPAIQPQAAIQNETLAFFSLRGGVGVSTLATNLAVGLAQIWGQPVALVDLAFISGQSALMLNLPLRTTWGDLANPALHEIDYDLLQQVLMPHTSGVHVLASAARPEQSELITGEKVAHVLRLLRQHYAYVVLDLPHDFSDTTLAGLDSANTVLLVLAPEIASVRATACALDVFAKLEYAPDKLLLLLNSTVEQGGLVRKDIELALHRPIAQALPYASEIYLSALNRGVPPVFDQPSKPLGAILERWAFHLSREEQRTQRPAAPTPAWQRVAQSSYARKTR